MRVFEEKFSRPKELDRGRFSSLGCTVATSNTPGLGNAPKMPGWPATATAVGRFGFEIPAIYPSTDSVSGLPVTATPLEIGLAKAAHPDPNSKKCVAI